MVFFFCSVNLICYNCGEIFFFSHEVTLVIVQFNVIFLVMIILLSYSRQSVGRSVLFPFYLETRAIPNTRNYLAVQNNFINKHCLN